MKPKQLLSAILILIFYTTTSAQVDIKYQGEINLGYSVGLDSNDGRLNVHTIQGAKIGQYISAGLGLGLDYYHYYDEFMIPLYLDIKGYYPINDRISPFIAMDLGYSIRTSSSTDGCIYFAPSIGVKYKNFSFQYGYTCKLGALQFKLGYIF